MTCLLVEKRPIIQGSEWPDRGWWTSVPGRRCIWRRQ